MALQPVIRRSVPEAVFDQIATDVLSGELPAGSALPSERRLAEVFGVSRPAVREALKRLSAASLVEVRQGGVTTVRDFRRHAGLDLLPQLVFRDGELDAGVFRSILETRLRIGPRSRNWPPNSTARNWLRCSTIRCAGWRPRAARSSGIAALSSSGITWSTAPARSYSG